MGALSVALWLTLAAQTPPSSNPAPTAPAGPARFRGALELSALSFPSGTPGGSQDLFIVAAPSLSFDGGSDFGLELGAPLRLRVFDDPPQQHSRDHWNVLRREDWDETSDFGQVLRELRIGAEASPIQLRAGLFSGYTLGHGQLISRYGNQVNPNYHPAGASLVAFLGPTRTELFASDILGGRILAGTFSLDLARTFNRPQDTWDRWHAGVDIASDFGRAGGSSPPMTLAWVFLDGVVFRGEQTQVAAHVGGGGRYDSREPSFGATLGLALDAQPRGMKWGGRLELRKQNGGFRQGMIGYDYELARFSAIGLGFMPIAAEVLPDNWSVYGEVSTAIGGGDPEARGVPDVVASVAVERYFWGRTHVDVSVSGRALQGKLTGGARLAITGLGEAPRYLAGVEARWRFLPSLYALGQGGTVF
ncbi:MAG: hypothetical protein WBV82_27985, partial [Myxococcaceae bacterium]